MIQWILIIALIVLFIGVSAMLIFTARHHAYEIRDLYELYDRARDNYTDALHHIDELNTKYSKSLDDREMSYNDILKRCKKLELELGEKDAEIIKLQARLYTMSDAISIDTSKGPDSEV